MGNLHAPTALSAPLGLRPEAAGALTPSPASWATPRITPEPPSLGTLPTGPRGPVAVLSLALYAGLLGGALGLAAVGHAASAPTRVVSVSLETFDAPLAPALAPVASNLTTPQPGAASTSPSELPVPPETPALALQASETALASAQPTAGSGGQGSGQAGGSPGGGLVGQATGSSEGSASGVIAPSFDAAYLHNPEPSYPALSKRFGEEGRVLLRVLVSPDGLAEQLEVRQSSGHARLDQAALGTVKRWRFTPARRGAERLAAWVLVPLTFQLEA